MGSPKNMESHINNMIEPKSQDEELLNHYYSQVSKKQIRELAEKYQVDMDLFGYDPEYFINFGTGD